MGISGHLLAFLCLSSTLLHSATSVCVPRPSGVNPIYPFLGGGGADAPPTPRCSDKTKPSPDPAPATSPAPSSALSPSVGALDAVVEAICSHTDNPGLCFSAVKSLLPVAGELDAAAVLRMQIKACAHRTQAAREESARISGDPGTAKMTASILQTCTDSYDDALDNLDAAVKAMAARDAGSLNSMLSAALTDYGTCEDGFMETPGIKSPMAAHDDELGKLASNCLAIAELVMK